MSCFLTLQIFSPILSYLNSLLTTKMYFLYLSVKDKISISLVHLLYFRTKYLTSNIYNINCQ